MVFTLDELATPVSKKAMQEELYRRADEEVNPSCYDCEVPSFGHRTTRGTAI